MGKIEIKGDNNQVYSEIKDSVVNSHDNDIKINNGSAWKWVGLLSLIVAVIGLILKFIIGWDAIVQFFN